MSKDADGKKRKKKRFGFTPTRSVNGSKTQKKIAVNVVTQDPSVTVPRGLLGQSGTQRTTVTTPGIEEQGG